MTTNTKGSAVEYQIVDGAKSLNLASLPSEAWDTVKSGAIGTRMPKLPAVITTQREVGVVNRCINVRATTLASSPWAVYDGESVKIDSNENLLPPDFDWLDDLSSVLFLAECSLALTGEAFLYKVPNPFGGNIKGLQWLDPRSITVVWDQNKGITGFERRLSEGGVSSKSFTPDEIVYIWRRDVFEETRPARSPAYSALSQSETLMAYDLFVKNFFERGAVKATILRVDKSANPQERRRLKNFWSRVMSGVRNAWRSEIISSGVEPVIVGDGMKEIDDGGILDNRKRTIATTLGVPHSIVFSNASTYSTAAVEERNFYTYTIMPQGSLIQDALNKQVFKELGLKFRFEWQMLSVFQTVNLERSKVYRNFIDSGMPPGIAAQISGIPMPEAITYEDFGNQVEDYMQATADAAKEKELDQARVQGPTRESGSDNAEKTAEIATLTRWVKKRGASADVSKFNSDILSEEEKTAVALVVNRNAD